MDISIKVLERSPEDHFGLQSVLGQIQIGKFRERFMMPIEYWTIEDYEEQWKEGLDRIKVYDQSCLITAIQDPKWDPFLEWWALYKEGNTIFVQNYLFPAEVYQEIIGSKLFTRETCYQFIPARETVTEEGEKVAEWKISLGD